MKINHIIVSTEKVIENKRPMSRAAKGNEKYGKNGMKALAKAGREGVAEGDKKPYPKTWHDVDPKLGKQVDKMSQAEKVKKGLAHPDTLKKSKEQGVAEGMNNWALKDKHTPTVKLIPRPREMNRWARQDIHNKAYDFPPTHYDKDGKDMYGQKKPESDVAEGDSQEPKGRMKSDGTRSHSTYGSRDHYSDSDPQHTATPTTAKKTTKQATDIFNKAFKDVYKKQGVAEVSNNALKSYQQKVSSDSMKHKADPTKRSPEKANRSVAGFAKAQNRLEQGVAEGPDDTVYPNAKVIKSKNGKSIGEIYQDEYGWGCFHYKADNGGDGMSSKEEALEQLKDMHNEHRRQGMTEEDEAPIRPRLPPGANINDFSNTGASAEAPIRPRLPPGANINDFSNTGATAGGPPANEKDLGNGFTLTTTNYNGQNYPAVLDTQSKTYWIEKPAGSGTQYGMASYLRIVNGKADGKQPGDQTVDAMNAAGWKAASTSSPSPSPEPSANAPFVPRDYQTKEPLTQGTDGKWRNSKGEERDSLHGGPVAAQGTAQFRSLNIPTPESVDRMRGNVKIRKQGVAENKLPKPYKKWAS